MTEARLLSDPELSQIEGQYPEGLTSQQIVDLFLSQGVRFSEATLRKYVQLDLLSRSRRVGRKGKHRGSQGLYPAATVRRINAIKRMMAQSYTIEEVRRHLSGAFRLEGLQHELEEVMVRIERQLLAPGLEERRRALSRELGDARKKAGLLFRQMTELERRIGGLGPKRPEVGVPPPPPQAGGA
jgi:DNA-binding transcriptional MerR regulator